MPVVFVSLSLVLLLATFFGLLVRWLKMPIIIGYIATGLVLGSLSLIHAQVDDFFYFLPEIGFAFLLFLVGIELDFDEVRHIGKTIFVIGFSQITLTALLGALIALGFSAWVGRPLPPASALILGLGLAFSSTIIVVKLLIEDKSLQSLSGKLAVGVLLVEDLVAIFGLMLISLVSLNSGSSSHLILVLNLVNFFLKAGLLFLLTVFLAKDILPWFFKKAAVSGELLFLASVTWCLILVGASTLLGFSSGVGAFLAGLALANSDFRLSIVSKISPLRDFFIALFFIDLGTKIHLGAALASWPLILAFAAYALVVKPSFFLFGLSRLKLKKHTFFKTAVTLSSISEFSLILVWAGVKAGLVSESLFSGFSAAAVIAMALSTLLIANQERLYSRLQKPLKKLEKQPSPLRSLDFDLKPKLANHLVLLGCHRAGNIVLKKLVKTGKFKDKILVVDFNPNIVKTLNHQGFQALYGDIADGETLENLNLKQAKIIISTLGRLNDNLALLRFLNLNKIGKDKVYLTANDKKEAHILRTQGAKNVLVPLELEGQTLARILLGY